MTEAIASKKGLISFFSLIRLDRPRPLCLLTKRLSFNSLNRIWLRKSRVAENTLDLRSDIGIFSHQCLSLFTFFISHSAISNCGHCYGLGLCLYFIYLNHHLRSNFRTLSFLAIHFYFGFVAPPHNIWNMHCTWKHVRTDDTQMVHKMMHRWYTRWCTDDTGCSEIRLLFSFDDSKSWF